MRPILCRTAAVPRAGAGQRHPTTLQGLQKVVASCWADELGLPMAGLQPDSDFRALSGDSLVALQICTA